MQINDLFADYGMEMLIAVAIIFVIAFFTGGRSAVPSLEPVGTTTATPSLSGRPWWKFWARNPATEPALSIDTITPDSGSVAGGETVIIVGSGFTEATTVHFGNQPATILSWTIDQLEVETPPFPAGAGPVTIRVEDGAEMGEIPDGYNYT